MNWQPWQWRMDMDWEAKPRVERFTRSLDGDLILWDAFVFPILGQPLSYVLLRNVESDDLFCVCDSSGDPVQSRLSESSEAWSVRMVCADALNNAKIARLFFLGDSGQLREPDEPAYKIVVVRANGEGLWNTWPESRYNRAAFRLFDDAGLSDFMHRPAMQVWDTLNAALKDQQSEAVFARHWSAQADECREKMVWKWPSDARKRLRAEMEEWLRCALLCDDSLWQTEKVWEMSVPDSTTIWLSSEDEPHAVSDQLKRAVERIWQHYAPFNLEVLAYDCAYAWKQSTVEAFHVEVSEPTAHERLEAMLRWRDWLTEAEV